MTFKLFKLPMRWNILSEYKSKHVYTSYETITTHLLQHVAILDDSLFRELGSEN